MKRAFLIVGLLVVGCSGGDTVARTQVPFVDATLPPLATEAPVATEATPSEAPPATSKPLNVKVTARPNKVSQNATASVTIKTNPGAMCSIDVVYASGSSEAAGLDARKAGTTGAVVWKWKVGRNTTKGTWPIHITCDLGDRSGTVDTSVTVK